MAKQSSLSNIGLILALIGGIIMVIYGLLRIIGEFINEVNELLVDLLDIDLISGSIGGNGVLVAGIIALVLGLVVIWIWKEKKVSSGDSLLIWGIVFIIIGIIGGSLGGLLVLVGGILFLVDYFF